MTLGNARSGRPMDDVPHADLGWDESRKLGETFTAFWELATVTVSGFRSMKKSSLSRVVH